MRKSQGMAIATMVMVVVTGLSVARSLAGQAERKAKAKKLLEAGGFDASLRSEVATVLAGLRLEADDQASYDKWVATVKVEDVIDVVAEGFAKHADEETLDAAQAFYESPAGKEFVKAQLLAAKARQLAALTQSETAARFALEPTKRNDRGRGPQSEELAYLGQSIGLMSAAYAKTLSETGLDGALAFFQSAQGGKYAVALRRVAEEAPRNIGGWFEERISVEGSPFARVKIQGNEASAIGALKTICTAETIFREGDKENDGNLDYGMLSELSETQLIDGVLGSGTKQGYLFTAGYSPTTSEFLWYSTAFPQKPNVSGKRFFFTNHAGVIYYSDKPFDVKKDTCEVPAGLKPVGR